MKAIFSLFLCMITLLTCGNATAQDTTAMKNLTDNIVQPIMSNQNTPGIAVAIHANGQDYIFCYGVKDTQSQAPITANTIFELASITKVFTTSALGVLVGQGKMQVTDPIVKFLPSLVGTRGLPIDQVKIVDLATHTASFPRDTTDFGVSNSDEPGFMQALRNWQPTNPVSSQYLYSNVGFGLLGKVLENASGLDYQSMLTTDVLTPLGMNSTFVFVPANQTNNQAQGYNARGAAAPFYQPQFFYGGGALRTTAADMLQFLNANLGVKANVPASLQQALNYTHKSFYQVRPDFNMGLGWQRMTKSGNLLITKNGLNRGFTSFIGFAPNQKFGVVVLANKRDAMATKIGNQLLNALAGGN
jgi:beta-lactamase class C